MSMSPQIGWSVLVNIGPNPHDPSVTEQLRPAVIVRVWSGTTINALVFVDGENDAESLKASGYGRGPDANTWWVTSISQGEGKLQWRHPASEIDPSNEVSFDELVAVERRIVARRRAAAIARRARPAPVEAPDAVASSETAAHFDHDEI